VRDDAEPGASRFLEGEHDAELALAARVAVVGERDGPRDWRAFVVVGRMVVKGIVDGSAHARHPTRRVAQGWRRSITQVPSPARV
jgi:hypothetical protein